ncbi:MAG: hypothetical protein JST72_07240 [Bacteroidetes bacterium]|nr:hypothetical protein [Bacteroidota bacterium]
MKIAVIDNTCNNGYVIMRYLNDLGLDTDLVLLNEVSGHADPLNDTFNKQYFDKIINTNWRDEAIFTGKIKKLKEKLKKYDFVIGSDYSPALLYALNRKLDVFLPHGTDVFNYPFEKFPLNLNFRKKIGSWLLSKKQRLGITNNTNYFVFELTNEENESYVRRFKNPKFKRIYLTAPLIYMPQYTDDAVDRFSAESKIVNQIKKLKSEDYNVIFHHCQQQWKNPYHPLFDKGNDKLIRGFAAFIHSNPGNKFKLVMIERGTDVMESKKLIADLKISQHILWLPFMPRKEIMACLHYADLGIGELGHSWYTYTVVSEFMAMGVPIVHKCDIPYYKTAHENIYPMYSVDSDEDIFKLLTAFNHNPDSFKRTGAEAKQWYHSNILLPFLDFIQSKISEKNSLAENPAV